MKLKIFSILFVSLFFFSAFACTNKSRKSRKPVAKISLVSERKTITFGDSVSIQVDIKLKDGELGKADLYLNNELVKTSGELNFRYQVGKLQTTGKYQVKVVALKSNGLEGVGFLSFEVLSDITPEIFTYEIVKSYPHNTEHFTQGLEIHKGDFYESTGEYEKSGIFKFDLQTGRILQSVMLEDKYFGEGITIKDDKLYQLTYKAQKGFIYDLKTFEQLDSFTYETPEGWGLTHDSRYIIKTDGSEFLHFIDPATMKVVKRIAVYDDKGPVKSINELEYYQGHIYANIWPTSYVVKIDPQTGKVISKIDFDGLLSVMYDPEKPIDVLNGIAINDANGKMYVTGKLWPNIFEVRITNK